MKTSRNWKWMEAGRTEERSRMRAAGWTVLGAGAVLLVVSCATGNRIVVAPPFIPGAEMVGSEACADCHQEVARDFFTASHARLKAPGENAKNAGCESCHGPGSRHVASGGAVQTIINPGKSPEVCFQCHLDMRGRFNLPYRHPVMEGQMSCGNCHNAHKGSAHQGGGTLLASANDVCLQCHTGQGGPHVFEHEAVREGCVICHQPHGSVNAKMLLQRNANLCLKCHLQAATANIQIGGVPHSSLLRTGTCWTAGCHEAVHGSQVSTTLRF